MRRDTRANGTWVARDSFPRTRASPGRSPETRPAHPRTTFFPYARGDRIVPGLEDGTEGEYLPERLVDESIGFIDRSQDGPFFLYLSHYTVHTPIQAREEITERYRAKPPSEGHENPTYAAMIESLDQGVGRILEALEERGLSDNTVVIFASDNGGFGTVTSMAPLPAKSRPRYRS